MASEAFSFPHPVLGLSIGSSEDIEGGISLQMSIERVNESRTIRFIISDLEIQNKYIADLVETKKAGFLIKIYCSSTLKTWVFINPEKYFDIPEDELCNKVEIEPKLIALSDINDYSDSSFNSEYNGITFSVNKSEVIGILDKIIVPIDKQYETLGLGNIFEFEPEPDNLKPCSFDFQRDKILIRYPITLNGDHPPTALFASLPWTAFNIFIIPALTEAFRIMSSEDEKGDYEENEWFFVLDKLLPKSDRHDDAFINAQILTDRELPVLKSFKELHP